MNNYIANIVEGSKKSKLEKFVFAISLLIIFKIIFPLVENSFLVFINEILIYSTLAFAFLYFSELTSEKGDNPISLALNVGILTGFLFFVTSLSSAIFDRIENIEEVNGILYTFVSVVIAHSFIISAIFILSSLQTFYYLRQKRVTENYFNFMLLAVFLSAFSATLSNFNSDFEFVEKAFFIVAILILVYNSFRVSWIAFLEKKQKVFLLFVSIIMSLLFALNYVFFS